MKGGGDRIGLKIDHLTEIPIMSPLKPEVVSQSTLILLLSPFTR